MAKELYIYSPLWDFTAETVVKQLNEVPENEELTMRLNTPGGEVTAGWSIISKMSERSGAITGIIDGDVSSMGAILLPFFDNVIANDTSNIMFHKAAWPIWKTPNEAEAKKVKKVNAEFKEKLSKKVKGKDGAKEFLAKVFEPDVRNDVELTAIEAKKLGIVDNVRKLQPKAEYIGTQIVAIVESKKEIPNREDNKSNIKKMDKATLKAENPSLYAAILAEGEKAGIKIGADAERDRVGSWTVFNEVNPEAVKTGIESGLPISAKQMSEFTLQIAKGEKVIAAKKDNPNSVNTEDKDLTPDQIQAKKDKDLLDKELGKIKSE